ncbi:hypothetical protein ACMU_14840 [Actibacterium mucosum KCTC 23349]|uniref:Metallopeptidase n=1 Tax=Actibacterium mucosum KCTC 23349 TaxID=1454373 RepID=A0A037ZEY6_9RHOB|nr:DUF4344 domain-containing metallopeptidase [Actibacterium mucosum]KAJ55030.1 hypothetical protein ACMU_14840 [Actibacterium mucosum KCTC 23349]
MTRFAAIFAMILALASPARALDDDVAGYVESNLLAIFYHELGHALIDLMGLPVFGQEEDAADVLSVVLIDAFFEEEAAVQIAYDTAFGFYDDAQQYEPIFWGVHGPDLQRYYTLVCLFYGANPDERADVADELGLPGERAETCEEEFDLAADSWGSVLDELAAGPAQRTDLVLEIDTRNELDVFTAEVMQAEMDALAEDFALPGDLLVAIAPCGEANAFYDPSEALILMCTELTEYLANAAP